MAIKARIRAGNVEFFESTTGRIADVHAPVHLQEQFFGSALDTNRWTVLDVSTTGDAAPAYVNGEGAGGACAINLDNTSEAQDSGIYFNDIRNFNVNAGLIFETTISIEATIGTGVKLVFGMAGDHNLDKDTIAEGAWFGAAASNALIAESDDTTNNNDDKATGITAVNGTKYICRIDFRVIADVKFFIDGSRVASATTFDMSSLSDAEALMQPYFMLDKASGAAVGTLYIHQLDVWSD